MTDTASGLAAIERTIELKASPDRVWRAISDPGEVAQWFPQGATWELQPGAIGSFFFEGDGDFPIRIEAVDAPHYLAWRWPREAGGEPVREYDATLVEWWVEARDGGGTTLRVRESGFTDPQHRAGNDRGWTSELAELVDFLED